MTRFVEARLQVMSPADDSICDQKRSGINFASKARELIIACNNCRPGKGGYYEHNAMLIGIQAAR